MSGKSLAFWAAGQVVTNPYVLPGIILSTSPAGREFVAGAVVEGARYTGRMMQLSGRVVRNSFLRWKQSSVPVWIKANPVLAKAGGIVTVATAGQVISDQMIADMGGDVSGGFAAAPSHHLVNGQPWWSGSNPDARVRAARWSLRHQPSIPFAFRN